MAKHYYKALFEYDGSTGENMIPLLPGDILTSDDDQTNKDWYKVTKVSDGSTGLVPSSYVKEISPEEAKFGGNTRPPSIPSAPPSLSGELGGTSPNLGVNDLMGPTRGPTITSQSSAESIRGTMMNSNTSAAPQQQSGTSGITASQNMVSASEGLPDSFAEMFQRHDAYFRQVVKQREESFKKLESALAAACKDIAACKEKNAKLTQRITELDALIEEERRKWRERLEIEKKNLLQNTQ